MKDHLTETYYNENYQEFFDSTVDADVVPLYERFCKYVPIGGKILDLGCGSGRDVKAFRDMGYDAHGVDGSPDLCRLASEYTGIQITCMDFENLDVSNEYDAIWACASLLHVPSDKLSFLLTRLNEALKDDGILYMSFKYGDFEGERDGRFFTDMTEERFAAVMQKASGVAILEEWYSEDVRRGNETSWFNVILSKT